MARHEIVHRRPAAAERDVVEPGGAARLQELAGKMAGTADARRAVVHAFGPLGERQVLGQRLGRHAGMHDQHVREIDRHAYRRDVRLRIVADILHGVGIDRQHADIGEQDRVTVGRRAQGLAGRDVAAGARLVVDQHRQTVALGQLLRQDAGHDIAAAAGREADNQAELLRWKRLRPACRWQQSGRQRGADQ